MTKRKTFMLNAALTLTIATPTVFLNRGSFWGSMSVPVKTATSEASVHYAMNDTTQSIYTGAMNLTTNSAAKARAFEGRSQRSGEPSVSFAISQLAGITKAVTRYADGQLSSNCTSGNYSIANRNCTGSDGNAYKSLQAASDASSAGDTILIRSFSGTYMGSAEHGRIAPKGGTSLSNRTVYSGYLTERPVVLGFDGQAGAQYIYYKNMILDAANAMNSTGFFGISYSRAETIEIRNQGYHGILGADHSEFINLDVHDNGFNNEQCSSWGLGHKGQCHGIYTGSGTNNLIDGGRYYNNEGFGIHCYTSCQDTVIRNLRVDHNRATGMIVAFGTGVQVYNVIADNNGAIGVWLASDGAVASNITAYNNGSTDIQTTTFSNQTVHSIAIPKGIDAVRGTILSNSITSGHASSLFADAAKGNFQLIPQAK